MLDLLITGATIVDGTGSPRRTGDVGIRDGRIVPAEGPATRTIPADGLVVAPGFVDPHTHYDAQLFWDPLATPSNLHGVTTVLAGNCGFTLAPIHERDADYTRRMMAKVEGMPLPALETGLPWDWETFAEYLDHLDGRIGVNAGFLVGHAALRRYVMGESGTGSTATAEQTAEMVRLLHEAIEAGGLGFSSSQSTTHSDGNNDPVTSFFADRDEVLALCAAVADHEGTWLEYITTGCGEGFSDEEIDLIAEMSRVANRPLNWNVLGISAKDLDKVDHQLLASAAAAERGGRVVALSMPIIGGLKMSFATYCALYLLPNWGDVLYLDHDEKVAKLADPAVRRKMDADAKSAKGAFRNLANWEDMQIGDTFAAGNAGLTGRRIGDIAAERGGDPFDVLVDIVLADDLRTGLWPLSSDDTDESWRVRADYWRDPRILVGGSDAGAHLDRMCGARYTTEILRDAVRERSLLTLEEAVHLISDVPARFFGLRDRGRIEDGWHADLVLFDPETVGAEPIVEVADMPGGCARLHSGAVGVDRVIVAGTEIVVGGEPTGETPGTLLRSGRDTETVKP